MPHCQTCNTYLNCTSCESPFYLKNDKTSCVDDCNILLGNFYIKIFSLKYLLF